MHENGKPDPHVEQVLAEAETIRAGAASPQAGAAHQDGADDVASSSAPAPAWQEYLTEAQLCAVYGDVLLQKFGCAALAGGERDQAVQAWAEVLAKWFPSVKEFMGPELRLLTIYGLPIAGRMLESWMSVPSPASSAGAAVEKPLS